MSSLAWLINDDGECFQSNSALLRAELNGLNAGPAFTDYVIKNLGFVGLGVDRRGVSGLIRYRPETVAPKAFARLMYWLADQQLARVMVATYRSGGWSHELHGSNHAAYCAVASALRSAGRHEDIHADNEVLSQPAAMVGLSLDNPLHAAFRLWRRIKGDWSRLVREASLEEAFFGRYTLFERHGERVFQVAGYGSGLPACAVNWLSQSVGQNIQDVPDKTYGWSCALAYEAVMQRSEPALHDVDAYVRWNGQNPLRRRYKRLLLPFQQGSKTRFLLSASVEDPSINLRTGTI